MRERGKKAMMVMADKMVRTTVQQLVTTPDSGTRSISSSSKDFATAAGTRTTIKRAVHH